MIRTLKPVGPKGVPETSGSGLGQGTAELKDLNISKTFKTVVPGRSVANKKLNFLATLVYHDAKGELIQNKMNLKVTYKNSTTETINNVPNENVLRVTLKDVLPGEALTIEVQPKLVAVSGSVIPWGLAWDHFES